LLVLPTVELFEEREVTDYFDEVEKSSFWHIVKQDSICFIWLAEDSRYGFIN